MLSLKTTARLVLSLVLILVFSLGSDELRIAAGTMVSWPLGLFVKRHFSPPAAFGRVFHIYFFASFWLLAATNDIFYENTFGRFWDMYFERDPYDPDVPGSGFTDWRQTFRRRNRADIDFAWRFVRFAVCSLLGFTSLPLLIPFVHWQVVEHRRSVELERTFVYLAEHGEVPPWIVEHRKRMKPKVPKPTKRDTRYMRLSDDVIFVCGPGGGFERVVAGDYDGAVSRRRGICKEFA